MKIISITFSEILGERKAPPKSKMEIKTNLSIEDIQKEEIEISSSPALKFSFSYFAIYEPSLAKISLKGSVIALDDKNESEQILKEWKKKQFSHGIKLQMFNMILNKCNTKAVALEEELGLPFHIPFPQINPSVVDPKSASESSKKPVNYTG